MSKKAIRVSFLLMLLAVVFLGLWGMRASAAEADTIVSVAPAVKTVDPGETFTLDIMVTPAVPVAGAQFNLGFDPDKVEVLSVTEGNLLKQGGNSTFFLPGTINNTAGSLTGVADAIITPNGEVSGSGVVATLTMRGKAYGSTALTLSSVIVGDKSGHAVAIQVNGGNVTVTGAPEPQVTAVALNPAAKTANIGDVFTLDVLVTPAAAIAGAQFDLSYDPAKLAAQSVAEGSLLSQGGASTYFQGGTINNTAGTVTGAAGVIITPGAEVTGAGVFATITFQAIGEGATNLTLSNVIVGDKGGNQLDVSVSNGAVSVGAANWQNIVVVGSATAAPGSTVVIPIEIENASELAGGSFTLTFDPAVAVPTLIEPDAAEFILEYNLNSASQGTARIAFAGSQGVSGSGTLCNITFQVTGAKGSSTDIDVRDLLLNDENAAAIPGSKSAGKIEVIVYGDVNGDGEVTAADATMVLRAVVGLITLDPVQTLAADVSGDGTVTAGDATLILRYIVGLITEFPVEN
jgi:hypothetical protein